MAKSKFLFAILTLFACTRSMAYVKSSMNILVDGKTRNMVIYTPDNVTENLPLMIVTHGMNQSPEVQYGGDRMYELIDKEKFIVTYLRSNGNTWDIGGNADQHFVEQTIGEMYAKYKIDAHRVYWSGFSMGSMLMYHCMHNMTRKIAAFAPCSGIQSSEQPWNKVKGPINLIHCHAKDDSVFKLSQYDIHAYVQNMAKVNGENTYTKTTNYRPFSGATPGDREVWKNQDGYQVVLFMYQWGDHNPSHNNAVELWNFCKNIRLENIDPIPEPEKPSNYTISQKDEASIAADKLNGKVLFPTDIDCTSILYGNSGNDSPQNLANGSYNEIGSNEYCWFKFTRVTDAQTSVTGNLYTIQLANKSGNTYNLWGNQGYVNTPPKAWCLFALGIKEQYGEDAKNYGLWKVDYEEGKGYTIQNVGASEANENSWLSPAFGTPQAEKQYVRLYSKLTKVEESSTGITSQHPSANTHHPIFNLSGQRISNPQSGKIYIQNGKKFIKK